MPGNRAALSLVPDEPDQVPRLERFRAAASRGDHPAAVAPCPRPASAGRKIARPTLREVPAPPGHLGVVPQMSGDHPDDGVADLEAARNLSRSAAWSIFPRCHPRRASAGRRTALRCRSAWSPPGQLLTVTDGSQPCCSLAGAVRGSASGSSSRSRSPARSPAARRPPSIRGPRTGAAARAARAETYPDQRSAGSPRRSAPSCCCSCWSSSWKTASARTPATSALTGTCRRESRSCWLASWECCSP